MSFFTSWKQDHIFHFPTILEPTLALGLPNTAIICQRNHHQPYVLRVIGAMLIGSFPLIVDAVNCSHAMFPPVSGEKCSFSPTVAHRFLLASLVPRHGSLSCKTLLTSHWSTEEAHSCQISNQSNKI